MQPYHQLIATIYLTTNTTMKKRVENYFYLRNRLQVVDVAKLSSPAGPKLISQKQP